MTRMFATTVLLVASACATAAGARAQVPGQRLDTRGLAAVRTIAFPTMPAWRKGPEPWPPAPLPFTARSFELSASYFSGLRASYSPDASSTFNPAWASLSNELEAYPNGDAIADLGVSPFRVANGVLSLVASPMGERARRTLPADMPRSYVSGAFNTYPFSQTYGYFEITAKVPRGRGLWPAFWLLPVDDSWPPEIDAPEVLGNNTATAYFSLHTTDKAWAARQPGSYGGSATTDAWTTVDLSKAFHTYGVDWGPTRITFYVDRRVVASRPTPSDMHKPFYLIADLAVGGPGSWPGPPGAATTFPATLQIRSVGIWQRPSYVGAATSAP